MTLRRLLAPLAVATALGVGFAPAAHAARPADGSVGRADDNAPHGQSAGDHNKGYECDDNHGVGDGNPAHTGICETDGYGPVIL